MKNEFSVLEKELSGVTGTLQELDSKLKEARDQYTSLEKKNKKESNKKYSYLSKIKIIF